MSRRSWQRAERLDAARMADELWRRAGVRLVVEGPCAGGQVGAAFVRWEDGHRSVLKWRPQSRADDLRNGPLAACEAARRAGVPAPATELVAQVGTAVVMVQELLPGRPVDRLDDDLLDQVLGLNDRMAGLLGDRPDVPGVRLYLVDDGPGYCLHEPLRQYSSRTAALERRISRRGPVDLAGDDVVHLDFHLGNLLADRGTVTGLVDWDGAGRGDRRLDLVTLRFALQEPSVQTEGESGVLRQKLIRRLDDVLDQVPTDVLNSLWAHMSLRLVDWSIRHHTTEDVDRWLDLAGQRL